HPPVESQVQCHQHKPPVAGCHMHQPCRSHPSGDRKKCEHMAGHCDPACHQADHNCKKRQIHCIDQYSYYRIFPMEQISVPAKIQQVMGKEKHEHPCTCPFMSCFSPKLISHQE